MRHGIKPILVIEKSPANIGSEIAPLRGISHAHTCLYLLAKLHPESLRVRIVKIDQFAQEHDNSSTPEDCKVIMMSNRPCT